MLLAIQATHQIERVLREMSRLGTEGIVSFPNFGHWSHAWSILRGRMPISREMPYRRYDTPNLHLSTPKDFEGVLEGLGLAITRRAFLADGRPVGVGRRPRAGQAYPNGPSFNGRWVRTAQSVCRRRFIAGADTAGQAHRAGSRPDRRHP